MGSPLSGPLLGSVKTIVRISQFWKSTSSSDDRVCVPAGALLMGGDLIGASAWLKADKV